MVSRKHVFVVVAVAVVIGFALGAVSDEAMITSEWVAGAARLMGLEFSVSERDSMRDDLGDYLESYGQLRSVAITNATPPALVFNPLPAGVMADGESRPLVVGPARQTKVPKDLNKLAFYSVRDLAELIRTRKLSSLNLTKMYIARLRTYGDTLQCVITITEEIALEQARRADAEIEAGNYRGYLHGIPYGAKDLLAVRGTPTTWGAEPYRDQTIDDTATVVAKLEASGAVLVAKLTLGALAWGDVWYGGMTRNPWNLEQGSSGSSAGSASATSAGLVAFAIGTETWGSIVSPSTRCGTTGLRPTFGRVSRAGAMALSWSMDKIGPICRSVEDCALVLDAIRGSDGRDATVIDAPFNYDYRVNMRGLRIGFVDALFDEDSTFAVTDRATLDKLRDMGATLVPITLPEFPMSSMALILTAEAAAAFDDFTRSDRDDLLVRQVKNAWPNVFRGARFVPAVEYIQANRLRYLVIQDMERRLNEADVDIYVTPSFGGDNLLMTNLTGHPSVVLPNGFRDDGTPLSITFMGRLFGEGKLCAVAKAYQDATEFHKQHPLMFQ